MAFDVQVELPEARVLFALPTGQPDQFNHATSFVRAGSKMLWTSSLLHN
jgi:hypothetical protein